jgi:transposase
MIFVRTKLITKGGDVRISTIIKRLLNVNSIVVEKVYFETVCAEESLIVSAKLPNRKRSRCGICGKKSPGYDAGTSTRRWRCLDLGAVRVYIEADEPRVRCREHGVVAAQVPWARHGARMTYDFENTVAWLTQHSSRSVVSSLMRIAWNTVGDIVKRVYDDIKEKSPDMFGGLVRIGIDETSYKKGHKYMTVIVNHDTGALIWAARGHGKKVLEQFFKTLGTERCASILYVTADGARWIADCVAEHCPNAERSIDTFHVVQWATETLDEVRKEIWRDAKNGGAPKAKRKRGRPKAGESPPEESKASKVKGSKYALLKNPENLTAKQKVSFEMTVKSDPRLYRAYLLKEKLRLLFKLPWEDAMEELDAWIKWAQHCRIPQFVELQRKIRRHYDAILVTIKNGLSNARIEAVNNKIKLTIRMGYGFRNIDNMIALIMLRCSKLNLALPGRV